ncbi:hypothetical protein VIMY103929_00610 [Vibrio mytili]
MRLFILLGGYSLSLVMQNGLILIMYMEFLKKKLKFLLKQ